MRISKAILLSASFFVLDGPLLTSARALSARAPTPDSSLAPAPASAIIPSPALRSLQPGATDLPTGPPSVVPLKFHNDDPSQTMARSDPVTIHPGVTYILHVTTQKHVLINDITAFIYNAATRTWRKAKHTLPNGDSGTLWFMVQQDQSFVAEVLFASKNTSATYELWSMQDGGAFAIQQSGADSQQAGAHGNLGQGSGQPPAGQVSGSQPIGPWSWLAASTGPTDPWAPIGDSPWNPTPPVVDNPWFWYKK